MKRFIVGAMTVVALAGLVACDQDADGKYPRGQTGTSDTNFPGLYGNHGETVEEGVEIMNEIDAASTLCPVIDMYGVGEAGAMWVEAEPSVGSDQYEAAVFAAWYETNPCFGVTSY